MELVEADFFFSSLYVLQPPSTSLCPYRMIIVNMYLTRVSCSFRLGDITGLGVEYGPWARLVPRSMFSTFFLGVFSEHPYDIYHTGMQSYIKMLVIDQNTKYPILVM